MPFFFNDAATTEIYTLSLHDALPICKTGWNRHSTATDCRRPSSSTTAIPGETRRASAGPSSRCGCSSSASPSCTADPTRSEEHTSELQSRSDLVCRLLLDKKKKTNTL